MSQQQPKQRRRRAASSGKLEKELRKLQIDDGKSFIYLELVLKAIELMQACSEPKLDYNICICGNCHIQPDPEKDLTTEGVEPNPGPPKKASSARKRVKKSPFKGPSKMNILKVPASSNRVRGHGGFLGDIVSKGANWLGGKAGSWLEGMLGLGAYSVKKNSLIAPHTNTPNNPPTIMNSRSGTVIRHREFVQDIVSSTGFTTQSFPINLGLSLTFPWAAGPSASFTQVEWEGILFEYRSTATTSVSTSSSQAAGVVVLATQYNVAAPAFSSKLAMEEEVYVSSGSPYDNILHPIECDPETTAIRQFYIRNTSVNASDLRFNDIGNFQIAVTGCPANGNKIGELWVTYEAQLIKPQLPTAYSSVAPVHFSYNSTIYPSLVAPTAGNMFGTTTSKVVSRGVGSLGVTINPVTANNILFAQSGRYFVVLQIGGSSATVNVTASSLQQGVTSAAVISSGATYVGEIIVGNGAGSSFVWIETCVDVDLSIGSGPQGIIYTVPVIPASVINLDLFVYPVPSGFTARNPRVPLTLEDKYQDMNERIERLMRLEREYEVLDSKQPATAA